MDIIWQRDVDPFLEILERNTIKDTSCVADLKDRFNGTIVFAPAAIFIVFYLSNNTSFDWVLVNVTEQGEW